MHTLSNEILEIKIAARGAELQSIYNKQTRLEYMWHAGTEWPKKSPVLFPVVGGLKNNTYSFKNNSYTLSRHGFAREMDFELINQTNNSLTILLKENTATLLQYPFSFSFYVKYTLHTNNVNISYIVENHNEENLYFSVGAHPAFALPLIDGTSYEDYFLEFETKEDAPLWPISAEGLIENNSIPFSKNDRKLPLTKDLFLKDALVFKNLVSKKISIKSDKTPHGLTVSFDGFPYMGIWAAKNADFVCIEPWCGIADSVNATGKLEDKEGINILRRGESFERSFGVEVY
ncbi:MAG: aldose 1-epimerase family protein [Chitinophagaceae bacterium]|nr:aldose 1-epimerase family protein [Chitinophagaceae bacterium]